MYMTHVVRVADASLLPQALKRIHKPERILGSSGVGVKFNSPYSSYILYLHTATVFYH